MAPLTVVPALAVDDAAASRAWGLVMDAFGEALKVPGLPPGDREDLLVCHRYAAQAAGRPVVAPAGGQA